MIIFGLVAGLVFIGLFCYMAVYLICNRKHSIDQVQFNFCKAGAGAFKLGFQKLDDVLYWIGVGSLKEARHSLRQIIETYFQDARGPVKLARDIFMHTWPNLRDDPEYGNEVRSLVVSQALGVTINDETDVTAVEAGVRADSIGWPTIGLMAKAWARRNWIEFGELIRSLFREFMQPNGEIKIAMRVAPATFATLWGDKKVEGSHDVAQKLVEKYATELGWTPPVAKPAATAAAA